MSEIEQLLAKSWDQLTCMDGGMASYKIHGRMEDVKWNSPSLSFTIERHGGMKNGSIRAELQHWDINVDNGKAAYTQTFREKYRREASLKTKPLAENIGKLIVKKKDSKKLKWYDDKARVRVIIGKIIPDDVSQQNPYW